MPSLNSLWWRFLENYWFDIPNPPPRKRTEPLQVICVGPPRSGTESLQQALLKLGYDHTLHGWDIIFEKPNNMRAWTRLARRKWFNDGPGLPIRADEFDELLGHAVAVTDTIGSCFASDLIKAYPEAKVVLNRRRDLEEWMRSMENSMIKASSYVLLNQLSLFDSNLFWVRHGHANYLWPGLFKFIDTHETFADAVRARGKLAYEEHCNMVRGMVPPERLLDWSVEDGWEPLCRFLGKAVPEEPFPHVNTHSKGWKDREEQLGLELVMPALKNFAAIVVVVLGVAIGAGVTYYRSR